MIRGGWGLSIGECKEKRGRFDNQLLKDLSSVTVDDVASVEPIKTMNCGVVEDTNALS